MTDSNSYYKITDRVSGKCFYASTNLYISPEQLLEISESLGLPGNSDLYTAEEISAEEYEADTDSDEDAEYPEIEEEEII